ncbi:hypothetical protein CEXT_241231 [Caerostris extrusa]|uniref:Uncharacterized protein n=1 Tax=Caerostris extrusa TaxID=172846 RepID=A0AAV4WK60_CAEEX|nr:hypothetical protein CEXT_241231 [Caerostris extrusa]
MEEEVVGGRFIALNDPPPSLLQIAPLVVRNAMEPLRERAPPCPSSVFDFVSPSLSQFTCTPVTSADDSFSQTSPGERGWRHKDSSRMSEGRLALPGSDDAAPSLRAEGCP